MVQQYTFFTFGFTKEYISTYRQNFQNDEPKLFDQSSLADLSIAFQVPQLFDDVLGNTSFSPTLVALTNIDSNISSEENNGIS